MKIKKLVAIAIILVGLLITKAIVTGVNHWRISDAIYFYQMECISNHKDYWVDYSDMTDYYDDVWRWWDWSDKYILKPVEYEKIKPYIGQKNMADIAKQYFE